MGRGAWRAKPTWLQRVGHDWTRHSAGPPVTGGLAALTTVAGNEGERVGRRRTRAASLSFGEGMLFWLR